MQELHFAHHRHADCNFAVINFFWDRILGTYRRPVKKLSDSLPQKCSESLSGVVKTVQVPVG
jgi:sterol desaturase/sphingolipid hydroxylase (fatty acid hydroxylase superfamily)